jgi:hypothetical protein
MGREQNLLRGTKDYGRVGHENGDRADVTYRTQYSIRPDLLSSVVSRNRAPRRQLESRELGRAQSFGMTGHPGDAEWLPHRSERVPAGTVGSTMQMRESYV